jgi:protein required for attachment to host cells
MTKTRWLVTLDGALLKLYRQEGSPLEPRLVAVKPGTMGLPESADAGRDDPDGRFQSMSARRKKHEATKGPDPAEDRFAQTVAEGLGRMLEQGEDITLAAAPRMLGRLRSELPDRLRQRLSDEIDADYVNIPPDRLARTLADRRNAGA